MTAQSIKSKAYIQAKKLMSEQTIPGGLTVENTLITRHPLSKVKDACSGAKVDYSYQDQTYLIHQAMFKETPYSYILIMNHGEYRSITFLNP